MIGKGARIILGQKPFRRMARKVRSLMKGTVKMFNKEKGYGFIHAEDNRDYFFHYSALIMKNADEYKTAEKGENVEFDVEESERGPRAANVKKVD